MDWHVDPFIYLFFHKYLQVLLIWLAFQSPSWRMWEKGTSVVASPIRFERAMPKRDNDPDCHSHLPRWTCQHPEASLLPWQTEGCSSKNWPMERFSSFNSWCPIPRTGEKFCNIAWRIWEGGSLDAMSSPPKQFAKVAQSLPFHSRTKMIQRLIKALTIFSNMLLDHHVKWLNLVANQRAPIQGLPNLWLASCSYQPGSSQHLFRWSAGPERVPLADSSDSKVLSERGPTSSGTYVGLWSLCLCHVRGARKWEEPSWKVCAHHSGEAQQNQVQCAGSALHPFHPTTWLLTRRTRLGDFLDDTSLSMMDMKLVKAFLDVGLYESMTWARWGAANGPKMSHVLWQTTRMTQTSHCPETSFLTFRLKIFKTGPPSFQRVCRKNSHGCYLQKNCLLREFSQTFVLPGSWNQYIKGKSPSNARKWFLDRRGSPRSMESTRAVAKIYHNPSKKRFKRNRSGSPSWWAKSWRNVQQTKRRKTQEWGFARHCSMKPRGSQ